MPELPEVENLRRGLERAILGQKVKSVKVSKPKLVSGKGNIRIASEKKRKEFIKGLQGEKFLKIERRAKNLIFELSHGKIILAHLKMSGQFAYHPKNKGKNIIGGHPIELSEHTLPNKHTHIIFELEHGTLYYNDTRMFGYVLYYPSLEKFEKENHFALYGLEPLSKEFTPEYLYESLKEKSGKIKAVLMDQKIVTGLGNIYADESLFEAKIRPDRSATSIKKEESALLHKVIIRIIKRAIKVGGSSVATYRLLDESRGNYAREHKVYGKSGQKCPRCKTSLQKTLIQTRTTIFCSKCQR
ncbi:MAG: bifunctional DNA-formamidopyrimidine glycosylase/DNA-(apurinic or apyrimidinic site) lyase [bacterium]|nr:bifunctional DNA-formamidopyrimidine glycosylase/DNA-(apurinic or apyrimidinic site) lyase [bacterium]